MPHQTDGPSGSIQISDYFRGGILWWFFSPSIRLMDQSPIRDPVGGYELSTNHMLSNIHRLLIIFRAQAELDSPVICTTITFCSFNSK